jgi:stage II sporulation SpoE-like protein
MRRAIESARGDAGARTHRSALVATTLVVAACLAAAPAAAAHKSGPLPVRRGIAAAASAGRPTGAFRLAASDQARPQKRSSKGPVREVKKVIKRVPGWLWAALAGIAALFLAALAAWVFTALRARRAERQRRKVMGDVGLLQAALLPRIPAELAGLRLSTAYRPAEGPAAGGDFYDAFSLHGGLVGLVIGDISGHGRASLAQTATVRFTVRAYLEAGLEPRNVLKLSQSVLEDTLGDEFVTLMLAVYDPGAGTLTYAGAGHPPPILCDSLPASPVTAVSAPPIGTGLGTGQRQTTASAAPGTTICLYTDGLVEAMVHDRMLGRSKLSALLDGLGKDATATTLLDRVVDEADRTGDDMAVCLARVPADAKKAPVRCLVEELEVSRRDAASGIAARFLDACAIQGSAADDAVRKASALSEQFGAALLRVHRHEQPPRVEVTAATVEELVEPQAGRGETQ